MVTAGYGISSVLEAMRKGAYDYLLKPFEREQLYFAVQRALECCRLKAENRALTGKASEIGWKGLTGPSVQSETEGAMSGPKLTREELEARQRARGEVTIDT